MYYDMSTKNISFLKVYKELKDKGIKNNKFFLRILDKDLIGIDPYNKELSLTMIEKIINECKNNYWYFLREIVRLEDELNILKRYELTQENLSLHFCLDNNINCYTKDNQESIEHRLLWEYMYVANYSASILDKEHKYSRDRLSSISDKSRILPLYLQIALSDKNSIRNIDRLNNSLINSNIKALPTHKSIVKGESLARGMTYNRIWYNNFSSIPNNYTIYNASLPSFYIVRENLRCHNKLPCYGIIIDDNDLEKEITDEVSIRFNHESHKFYSSMYDMTLEDINNTLKDLSFNNFMKI